MLSSVLKSKTAVEVNIRIMRAFISMRRFIATNAQLFERLETIEYHQLEMKQHQEVTDKRIDEVLSVWMPTFLLCRASSMTGKCLTLTVSCLI